ncbi:MAG: S1C family serine protease [Vicinamibacteria bacterium]
MTVKSLKSLSEDIQKLSAKWSPSVVEVRGRRGAPSSGVAWSTDGLVIVAEHTLEHEEGIEIRTAAGDAFRSEILGRDPSTGIALLRAEKASLPVPDWGGTADLAAGEVALILACSRPARRVALTTVSAVGGEWTTDGGGRVDRYIETDARLFPGFSGSLLVGASGLGIALNTAGLRRRTAVAIPIETLRRVAKSLFDHGEIRRGFLGITTYPVRLPASVSTQRTGLLVLSVEPGSPAEKANLFLGDVILGIDSRVIESPGALLSFLTEDRIGKNLEARVLRSGGEQRVPITVGARS